MNTKILGLLAVGLLAGPMAANAMVVGTPDSENCIPFSCNIVANFQQGYAASAFGEAFTIKSLSFSNTHHDSGSYALSPGTFSLYLSTTSESVTSLTGSVGSNEALVFSGAAPASSTGGFGGRYDFVLASPFVYDPSLGNLLLRVTYSGDACNYSAGTGCVYLDADLTGASMGRYFNGIQGDSNRAIGLVTGFNLVPEPGTLALLSFGLAGLGLSRRRKAN